MSASIEYGARLSYETPAPDTPVFQTFDDAWIQIFSADGYGNPAKRVKGAGRTESIMDKLFFRNDGYISAAQLYEFVRAEMYTFLNDNGLDDMQSVFNMARHLFEKLKYHKKTVWIPDQYAHLLPNSNIAQYDEHGAVDTESL